MAKKKTPEIGSLLGGESQEGLQDQQGKQEQQEKPSIQQGLNEGWTRATFILREDQLHKLKAVAYWKRETLKETLDDVLFWYFKEKIGDESVQFALNLYEEKKGKK